jgi:hypothetical protein
VIQLVIRGGIEFERSQTYSKKPSPRKIIS